MKKNTKVQDEELEDFLEKDKRSSKKKNKKIDIFFKILSAIFAVITILFYISVIRLNLIPNAVLLIFTVILVGITIPLILGMAKRNTALILNIICLLLVVAISSTYIMGMKYIGATMNFLKSAFTEIKETEEYYIVVKKESQYQQISDLENIDIYSALIEETTLNEIKENINKPIIESEELLGIGNKLVNQEIESILISASQYDMLDDEVDGFKDNTRIIYTTSKNIETNIEQNPESKYTVDNGTFNIYISGIDTEGNINKVSRSDANMLLTINTNTKEVLMTSIPRDYYVMLHSKKAMDKLTHSGIYGINETVNTVEDLLETDINYYLRVNFTTLVKLVDKLEGIDVYSDYDFTTKEGYHFKKGYNHLNGKQALAFSRERRSFEAGDNQRVVDQQMVIEAIMKKISQDKNIMSEYTDILESLEGCFQTNIEQDKVSSLIKEQLQDLDKWNVSSYSLTGTDSNNTTYSMGNQKSYVMVPNQNSVEQAKTKIKTIMEK